MMTVPHIILVSFSPLYWLIKLYVKMPWNLPKDVIGSQTIFIGYGMSNLQVSHCMTLRKSYTLYDSFKIQVYYFYNKIF